MKQNQQLLSFRNLNLEIKQFNNTVIPRVNKLVGMIKIDENKKLLKKRQFSCENLNINKINFQNLNKKKGLYNEENKNLVKVMQFIKSDDQIQLSGKGMQQFSSIICQNCIKIIQTNKCKVCLMNQNICKKCKNLFNCNSNLCNINYNCNKKNEEKQPQNNQKLIRQVTSYSHRDLSKTQQSTRTRLNSDKKFVFKILKIQNISFDSYNFKNIKTNQIQLVKTKMTLNQQIDKMIIINLWGIISQHTQQGEFQPFKLFPQDIEQIFEKISEISHIILILKRNTLNKKVMNYIKQFNVDQIYIITDQSNLFMDIQQIIQQFNKVQQIYYFASLDSNISIIEKDGKNTLERFDLNKQNFINKIPFLNFPSFQIILFQNINFCKNINYFKVIIDILFRQNQVQLINLDISEQIKQQQENIQKQNQIKQFQNKIEIQKMNKTNNSTQVNKNKNMQIQIYNDLKLDAQKKKIQVFFSMIGDMFSKNQKINLKYQFQNQKLLQYMNNINYEEEIVSNNGLELDYIDLIKQNICFYKSEK